MKPKRIWANVAVEDLERTRSFYTQLGFKSNDPHRAADLTSFFFGDKDFIIHFFKKNILEPNMKGYISDPPNGASIIPAPSLQQPGPSHRQRGRHPSAAGS